MESNITKSLREKKLLIPPIEPFVSRLFVSAFRSHGFDAELIRENDATLSEGMKYTSGGECIPCPSTLGALMHAVGRGGLNPDTTAFWMPSTCGPCRFGQYAKLIETVLKKKGWERITMVSPNDTNGYGGIGRALRILMWQAVVVGDVVRKLVHKTRPYEYHPGETDGLVETHMKQLEAAFGAKGGPPVSDVLGSLVNALVRMKRKKQDRPLIGIVGEVYVRLNPFMNQDICRRIEELGGEVALAPASEWIFYSNYLEGINAGTGRQRLAVWLEKKLVLEKWEHHYYHIAAPILHDRREYPIDEVMTEGLAALPQQFEGESVLTLGRAALFAKKDRVSAVVNVSPMFCMPGTITSSMFHRLEKEAGIPVVNIFYDGSGDPNRSLNPVLHYLTKN